MAIRRPSPQTLAVLAHVARDPSAWRYGYDLSRETGLASGTLYPLLMRLCDRGYLESTWEETPRQGRPPRHLYRITPEGSAYLAAHPSRSGRVSTQPIEGTA